MQNIIILKDVEMPKTPRMEAGTKHRVNNDIADMLVERKLARYEPGKKAVTDKAKKSLKKTKEIDEKIINPK